MFNIIESDPTARKQKGQSRANSWQRIDRRATKWTRHLRATERVEIVSCQGVVQLGGLVLGSPL